MLLWPKKVAVDRDFFEGAMTDSHSRVLHEAVQTFLQLKPAMASTDVEVSAHSAHSTEAEQQYCSMHTTANSAHLQQHGATQPQPLAIGVQHQQQIQSYEHTALFARIQGISLPLADPLNDERAMQLLGGRALPETVQALARHLQQAHWFIAASCDVQLYALLHTGAAVQTMRDSRGHTNLSVASAAAELANYLGSSLRVYKDTEASFCTAADRAVWAALPNTQVGSLWAILRLLQKPVVRTSILQYGGLCSENDPESIKRDLWTQLMAHCRDVFDKTGKAGAPAAAAWLADKRKIHT